MTTQCIDNIQDKLTGIEMHQGKFELGNSSHGKFNQHIVFPGIEEITHCQTGTVVQAGKWVKSTAGSILNDKRMSPELKIGFTKTTPKQVIFNNYYAEGTESLDGKAY